MKQTYTSCSSHAITACWVFYTKIKSYVQTNKQKTVISEIRFSASADTLHSPLPLLTFDSDVPAQYKKVYY